MSAARLLKRLDTRMEFLSLALDNLRQAAKHTPIGLPQYNDLGAIANALLDMLASDVSACILLEAEIEWQSAVEIVYRVRQ